MNLLLNYFLLEKNLRIRLLKTSGRNNKGRITFFHRGGGHKKFYRLLNFLFLFKEIPFYFLKQIYDPNRNVFVFIAVYFNGFIGYFLKPFGSKIGDVFTFSFFFFPQIGCIFPLRVIPVGSYIYNIQQTLLTKAVYVRAAGDYAKILKHYRNIQFKFFGYTLIQLPSKEKKLFLSTCLAFLGKLSNFRCKYIKKRKAGEIAWLGRRPHVRGVAMNPIDHPHGGNTAGGRPSVTPWGLLTKGKKTKNFSKSIKFILNKK